MKTNKQLIENEKPLPNIFMYNFIEKRIVEVEPREILGIVKESGAKITLLNDKKTEDENLFPNVIGFSKEEVEKQVKELELEKRDKIDELVNMLKSLNGHELFYVMSKLKGE